MNSPPEYSSLSKSSGKFYGRTEATPEKEVGEEERLGAMGPFLSKALASTAKSKAGHPQEKETWREVDARKAEAPSEVLELARDALESEESENVGSAESKNTDSAADKTEASPRKVAEEEQSNPPSEPVRRLSLSPEIEKKSTDFFKSQRRGSIKVNLTDDEHNEASKEYTHRNPSMLADGQLTVSLVPHVHTLFCERKERVCMSHGKLQEHEKIILNVKAGDEKKFHSYCWYRSEARRDDKVELWLSGARYDSIEGTEGQIQYQLTCDDVGKFMKFAPFSDMTGDTELIESATVLGPVLPAPPRFISFTIQGDLVPGKFLMADSDYTGGLQGASEFWWMRISKGERKILGEPVPLTGAHMDCSRDALRDKITIVENKKEGCSPEEIQHASEFLDYDPRVYKLTQNDVGCIFKVKCRPTRSDGYKGEIFTSKPSGEIKMKSVKDV